MFGISAGQKYFLPDFPYCFITCIGNGYKEGRLAKFEGGQPLFCCFFFRLFRKTNYMYRFMETTVISVEAGSFVMSVPIVESVNEARTVAQNGF